MKKVSSSQPFINYLNYSMLNDLRLNVEEDEEENFMFDFSLPSRATYGT